MEYFMIMDTIFGKLRIMQEDQAIVKVQFAEEKPTVPRCAIERETPLLLEAQRQLQEYFNGQRSSFSLPLNPDGTEFQKRVWQQMEAIPYGETKTYGQIAAAIGQPGASRAVGGASHNNPIAIIIPCHRVIGSNGAMTGYASGVDVKEKLLRLEGALE